MNGIIKRLTDKGFGFIAPEATEENAGKDVKDIFFHSEALVDVAFDSLRVDQAVTFEVDPAPSEKGPRAINVRLA